MLMLKTPFWAVQSLRFGWWTPQGPELGSPLFGRRRAETPHGSSKDWPSSWDPQALPELGESLEQKKTDGAIPNILLWFIRFINAVIIVLLWYIWLVVIIIVSMGLYPKITAPPMSNT